MFEWDAADGENVDHLAVHGVTPEEAEEVFDDPQRRGMPAYQVKNERRFRVLGATEAGRILLMVFVRRGRLIRVFSARDAEAPARRLYRRKK